MLERAQKFLDNELWLLGDRLTGLPKMGIRTVQVLVITIKDYVADKCGIRAAALTFYSTLSLVPILALLFGIAKGFGFEAMLKDEILESGGRNQEMLSQMFSFAENTLANAKGGVVAGIGILLLFYTLLRTIGLIEQAFNDIWLVKQSRTWLRKFTDYLSITLLAPILLILSGSVTVFVQTNVEALADNFGLSNVVGPAINFGFSLIPYVLIWMLFLGLYVIMPNRRVPFKPALIAAIVAGTIYQLVEWVYITFQIGVSNYNGIYGSFAALPLFLVWVQTSWTIVLFGAELANAIHNMEDYIRSQKKKNMTPFEQLKFGVLIMRALLMHATDKVPFVSIETISEELGIGYDRAMNVLQQMEEHNLVISKEVDGELEFQSARDSKEVNVLFVLKNMLGDEGDGLPEQHGEIEEWIQQLETDLQSSKGNVYLRP